MEARAVDYLILNLLVAQAIIALQEYDLDIKTTSNCGRLAVDLQSFFTRISSRIGRNISKSTRAASTSSGLPIADRATMVSSSSKRFSHWSSIYRRFLHVFAVFTAKVLNLTELSPQVSDYQLFNF